MAFQDLIAAGQAGITDIQQVVISAEITRRMEPIMTQLDIVNQHHARNATALDERIETMRAVGKEFEANFQTQVTKMYESGENFNVQNEAALENLRNLEMENSVALKSEKNDRTANDLKLVQWKIEVEKYIADGAASSASAHQIQQQQLQTWISQQKIGLQQESGGQGGRSRGNSDGSSRLCNSKETTVAKLPESMQKSHFLQWRKGLELHLETFMPFKGVTKLLRVCRNASSSPRLG